MMDLCERGEGNLPRRELDGWEAWCVENGDGVPHALDANGTVVGTRE
jgi:hypothetical protein